MSGRGRKTPRKSTPSPVPRASVENNEPVSPPDAQDVSYSNLSKVFEGSPPREKKARAAPGAPKKPKRGGRRTLKRRFHKK
jgi:hypothetical protein